MILGQVVRGWFLPGRVYAFVGAGGKTTAMRTVARLLAAEGIRVRLSTTTRLGEAEFAGCLLQTVHSPEEMARALASGIPQMLLAAKEPEGGKLPGISPGLIDSAAIPCDTVFLVECDGARRMPMKAPRQWEPVVPESASGVFALMGASAFGKRISADTCYNPEGALEILGIADGIFDAHALAVLASHPLGCRKGVPRGAAFRLVVNQADIEDARPIGAAFLRELAAEHGIGGALLSWREGTVYEITGEPFASGAPPC